MESTSHRKNLDPRSTLPITHPDFLYPISKNPYYQKLLDLKDQTAVDQGAEGWRGRWRSLFSAPEGTPLHVEVGCNGGHVLVEWAKRDPSGLYLGVDWKFKQIYRAWERAQKVGAPNARFARAHAWRLPYLFAPEELTSLSLFFPDPWPRKGQWKLRIVQTHWISAAYDALQPGGILHLKTDHRDYFEWMLDAVAQAKTPKPWIRILETWNLHENHPAPESLKIPDVTLFERLFIRDQLPIHALKLQKPL